MLRTRSRACANEKVISSDDWTGYFNGVKGNYIFFDAEDGWNDGMGFAVFSPDAKKIFDDTSKKWIAIDTAPGGLTLHYERTYEAKCSLQSGDASCWPKIKAETGLTDATPPDCAALYVKEQKRTPKLAKEVLTDPTVIEYEVSVALTGHDHKTTAANGKALRCRPAD